MAECDANYIRLCRLFPRMHEQDSLQFGVRGITEDGAIVTMTIDERCPYTTMLTVNISNDEDKPWVKWTRMEIRVYHDLCSAEVVSFQRHRNFRYRYPTPNPHMFQPDEKSQINRFFGELLSFCIAYGQSLDLVGIPRR